MSLDDGVFRKVLKWTSIAFASLVLLLMVAILAFLSPGLYNRFYYFPKEKASWEQIAKTRVDVQVDDGWNEYKGSIHSHSEISHDSKVPLPVIQQALHEIKSDFILMSDHFVNGKADYSLGWKGDHDGILFVRGFEMQEGLMPWGLPDSTVLDENEDVRVAAKKIKDLGGIVTYAHCEQPRVWDLPELEAMEIYNVHATILKYKENKKFIWKTVTTILTSFGKYPDECFFTLFERPDEVLQIWDDLNISRHIAGYAGNDTHQNAGIKGVYLPDGKLGIVDTGHTIDDKKVTKFALNAFTRFLLQSAYGKLEPGKLVFQYDLDKYARSAKYVRTHLLAKACTEADLVGALRAGRAFLSFDLIADGTSFVYMAEGAQGRAVMGESIKLDPSLTLKAYSPYPCKFVLLRNGFKADEQQGTQYTFSPKERGKYRLELYLDVAGKDQLWLLTNPIEIAG
jgi:hypothetical protein